MPTSALAARGRSPLQRLVALLAAITVMVALSPHAYAQAADDAKRHFTNGVRLFEDRNFAGALVEFEASYQKNPTAVALQNIAVCQKGLFRYAEAIATLERMLREFATQLAPDDKKAAEDAIRDMTALLGTIVVQVTPADARVTINDAIVTTEALKNPVRLAAGEYRIVAEAPGYARQEKRVTVVSGQKDQPVVLTLTPLSGMLVIRAHDPQAAIAIDGVMVGYEEWKGPVSAGPHEIYVYTANARHKSKVVANAGQTTEFDAKLTAQDVVAEGRLPEPNGPPPYVAPSQRGLYGFLTFGLDSMGSNAPPGLNHDKARVTGGFGSLRFGYRFATNWAAEIMGENTGHEIAACVNSGNGCAGAAVKGNYRFTATRVGAAVRLMSSGRKSRVVATVGVGASVHDIKYDAALKATMPARADQTAPGSFFQIGGSYELNLGHFLFDAGLNFTAENADEQKVGVKNMASVGLEIRVGYGQW
jgi:hypothetical protein